MSSVLEFLEERTREQRTGTERRPTERLQPVGVAHVGHELHEGLAPVRPDPTLLDLFGELRSGAERDLVVGGVGIDVAQWGRGEQVPVVLVEPVEFDVRGRGCDTTAWS